MEEKSQEEKLQENKIANNQLLFLMDSLKEGLKNFAVRDQDPWEAGSVGGVGESGAGGALGEATRGTLEDTRDWELP